MNRNLYNGNDDRYMSIFEWANTIGKASLSGEGYSKEFGCLWIGFFSDIDNNTLKWKYYHFISLFNEFNVARYASTGRVCYRITINGKSSLNVDRL